MSPTFHGNCLDLDGFGVLIFGPPGAGKSDLSLRLINSPVAPQFKLVADDRVSVRLQEGTLIAMAPEKIAGLFEIRGVGIVEIDYVKQTLPGLVIELTARDEVTRLPDFPHQKREIGGMMLPELRLSAGDISTPDKIRAAIEILKGKVSLVSGVRDGV